MPKPLKEMEEKVKRNVKRIEGGEKKQHICKHIW